MEEETPLLQLPAELRNPIFELAVVQSEPIDVTKHQKLNEPALLATCRQIRSEALALFYSENTFSFTPWIVHRHEVVTYSPSGALADHCGVDMKAVRLTVYNKSVEESPFWKIEDYGAEKWVTSLGPLRLSMIKTLLVDYSLAHLCSTAGSVIQTLNLPTKMECRMFGHEIAEMLISAGLELHALRFVASQAIGVGIGRFEDDLQDAMDRFKEGAEEATEEWREVL